MGELQTLYDPFNGGEPKTIFNFEEYFEGDFDPLGYSFCLMPDEKAVSISKMNSRKAEPVKKFLMKEVKGKGFCQIEPDPEIKNEAAILMSFGIKF